MLCATEMNCRPKRQGFFSMRDHYAESSWWDYVGFRSCCDVGDGGTQGLPGLKPKLKAYCWWRLKGFHFFFLFFFFELDRKRLWCGRYASKCPPSTFSHRFSFLLSSAAVCSEDFIFMICFPERWAGVVLCDVTIQSAQRYKVCVQVARSPQC